MTTIRRLGRIVIGILRNLSDETAYERHLAAHNAVHSKQEWRRFSEHRWRSKYLRAKCC